VCIIFLFNYWFLGLLLAVAAIVSLNFERQTLTNNICIVLY
jgi:hypothetical protein